MSAATVLTSAMSGMPALSGSGGSLAALFRNIASIMGWSIEFDNGTDIIVLKPQSYRGGQAIYYRINDTSDRGGIAPKAAKVQMYESMTDVNTGAGLCGTFCISKSYYSSSDPASWAVIGDQFGFYILTCMAYYLDQKVPAVPHYLGFIELYKDSSTSVCAGLGCADSTYSGSGNLAPLFALASAETTAIENAFIHRSSGGALGKPVCQCFNGGTHPVGRCGGSLSAGMPPYLGELLLGRPYINDGAAYTIRGYLPGLYYPCHSSGFSAIGLDNILSGSTLIVDDAIFIGGAAETNSQYSYGSYGNGNYIFDIGVGFRP